MMELTLTFASWWIPAAITVVALCVAIFWPTERGGYMPAPLPIFLLVPALFVSAVAWAVWGFLKP